MTHEIIISGFGGQGVMAIGKTMVEAGMEEGLFVSWLPSYGPEMRGGTANCSVVLSDQPVGSPVVLNPNELIAMNKPSLLKFEKEVLPGGIILINSSIVELKAQRSDVSPASKSPMTSGIPRSQTWRCSAPIWRRPACFGPKRCTKCWRISSMAPRPD